MKQEYYVVVVHHYNKYGYISRSEVIRKAFKNHDDAEQERQAQFDKHFMNVGVQILPMEIIN